MYLVTTTIMIWFMLGLIMPIIWVIPVLIVTAPFWFIYECLKLFSPKKGKL